MPKILLNKSEMKDFIQEAIANVKAKPKTITLNKNDIKTLVESVIDEYYHHPSFHNYSVRSEFITDNEVPFTVIGLMSYGPGDEGYDQSTLEDYKIEDEQSYNKDELLDINDYMSSNAQEIIDSLLNQAEGENPDEEGERDYEPEDY
jgi:hypothetical protein